MSTLAISGSQDSSLDLETLRKHPVIQEYASMSADTYELVKATNPTLRMFVDMAKEIISMGGH